MISVKFLQNLSVEQKGLFVKLYLSLEMIPIKLKRLLSSNKSFFGLKATKSKIHGAFLSKIDLLCLWCFVILFVRQKPLRSQ